MSSSSDPVSNTPSSDERIARLEERLDRERKARRQAEMIAEKGMRDLWEVNRDLQQRVDDRTAQVARLLAGYERARAAWSSVMVDELDRAQRIQREGGDAGPSFALVTALAGFARRQLVAEPFTARPASIAGDVLQRWQRPTARHGQLLTTDADATDGEVCARWDCVVALCEVAITSIVHVCESGVVAARLAVDGNRLSVSIDHPAAADEPGRQVLAIAGAIVERAVRDGDGTFQWDGGRLEATFAVTT